jgi:hypothetical protein
VLTNVSAAKASRSILANAPGVARLLSITHPDPVRECPPTCGDETKKTPELQAEAEIHHKFRVFTKD